MNLGFVLLAWVAIGVTTIACLVGSGIVSIDIDISFDETDDQNSDPEEPKKP